MRIQLVCCMVLLSLLCLPVSADDLQFNGGWITCSWSNDSQFVTIQAAVDEASPPSATHMWVLTVYSHRFEDGIFAWQIHYSETINSVLVLPSDFLTARHFTIEQLGIEAELSASGHELILHVPISGAIPRLIAGGDLIELHALWIQQAPLTAIMLSSLGEAVLPAGGGASLPELRNHPVSTSLFPDVDHYVQGQSILHSFILTSKPESGEDPRIVLSYTLMRLHDDQTSEFVRFAPIPYDFDSGTYSYVIETGNLESGHYSLVIGSANSDLSVRMEFWITSPSE